MERIVVLMLVCLLLTGCGNKQESPAEESRTDHPTQEGNLSTENDGGLPELESDFFETCNTLYEYREFCREPSAKMPENFLKYEQIEKLGTFSIMWYMGITDVDSFGYELVDKNNRELGIEVIPNGVQYTAEEIKNVTPEDMRSVSGSDNGDLMFICDDLIYYYSNFELSRIYWNTDGADYILFADRGFTKFEPDPHGEIVERLLCLESATAARDELAEMIYSPYTPEDNVPSQRDIPLERIESKQHS